MSLTSDLWRALVYDPEGDKKVKASKPSLAAVRAGANLLGKVTDAYFNTRVEGVRNIPKKGPGIIVSNHGFLAAETGVLHNAIVRGTGRCPRAVGAHFIWKFPTFGRVVKAMGVVKGDRDVVKELLRDDELVMIYPGGVREAAKGPNDRERLFWDGRSGFVKVAMATGAPIVPAAVLGADDMFWRSEKRLDIVGKMTGDPDASMPIFMGLGPLPLPVTLTLRFGKPISTVLPEGQEITEELVEAKKKEVEEAVRYLLEVTELPSTEPIP